MSIPSFPEKDIRAAILRKIKPEIFGKRAKHKQGRIIINGKVVGKVKIPNNHQRVMKNSKSKYIAQSLNLNEYEFIDLIECPLTGPKYFELTSLRFS